MKDLGAIVSEFEMAGEFRQASLIPTGHINTTFRVESRSAEGAHFYILQKINLDVFKDPAGLMGNISAVTRFLDQKLTEQGMSLRERQRRVLQIVPCVNGDDYFTSEASGVWRMFHYIAGTHSVEARPSPKEIFQSGYGFGRFIAQLLEFPAHRLVETIPHFHHGPRRFKAFEESVAADVAGRAATIENEIAFIRSHHSLLAEPQQLILSRSVPLRVTHNDTKANNVLLDDVTDEAICVIDLDTVMPGLVLFDFGDLIRTTCTGVEEDEVDLDAILIDADQLEQAIRGFVNGTARLLTEVELQSLCIGPPFMALIMATRFVTDYLLGDTYFQIDHDEHNLQRGRSQLRLTQLLFESRGQISKLLSGY